jgi:hypothetical protein
MGCQVSVAFCRQIGVTEMTKSVPPKLVNPSHCTDRSNRNAILGPTEIPNVHIVDHIGQAELSTSVCPSLLKCVTVGFCVEAICTPPPPLLSGESPQKELPLLPYISE